MKTKSLFLLSLIIFSVTVSAKVYVCTAPAAINIRTQPSTQGSVVGALQPNQTVDVVVIKGDWAMINYNGATAYVAAKFLTEQQSLPTSRQIVSASVNTKVDKQETQEKQEKQPVVVSQEGRLNVNSNPSEAQLYVDSQHIGLTPYEMRLDCKNSHTIRLEKEGYSPFQQTILLDAGQTRNINATLQKIKVPKVKPQLEGRKLFLGASVGGGYNQYDYRVSRSNYTNPYYHDKGGTWSIGIEGAYAITPMIGVGGYFSAGQSLLKGNMIYVDSWWDIEDGAYEKVSGPIVAVGALLTVGNYSVGKPAFLFGVGYEYVKPKIIQGTLNIPHESSDFANLRAGCLLGCGVYIMCEAAVGTKKGENYYGVFDFESVQYHIGLRVGYNFGRFIPIK